MSPSGNVAATVTTRRLDVKLNLTHIDQVYVLQEAVELFIAKCDGTRHWRAAEEASELASKLSQIAQEARAE